MKFGKGWYTDTVESVPDGHVQTQYKVVFEVDGTYTFVPRSDLRLLNGLNGHSKVLEAGQQVKYMTGIAECETGRFIDPAGSYRIRDGDEQLGDVHVARSAVVFKWNFDKISAIHNALNSLCSGGVYAENGRKLLYYK